MQTTETLLNVYCCHAPADIVLSLNTGSAAFVKLRLKALNMRYWTVQQSPAMTELRTESKALMYEASPGLHSNTLFNYWQNTHTRSWPSLTQLLYMSLPYPLDG